MSARDPAARNTHALQVVPRPQQTQRRRSNCRLNVSFAPPPDFRSSRERPAHAAIIEATYLAEVDLQFDDTRAARIHRKEEAKSKKATTEMRFPKGQAIWVSDSRNPFATFGGTVQQVTKAGKIKALLDIFGRLTPVEFEAGQLWPAV